MYHVLNKFNDAQAVTNAAGASTDIVDTGYANVGNGGAIDLEITVTEQFAGGTSCQFALQSSVDETAGNFGNEILTKAFTAAQLAPGTVFKCAIPNGVKRYLRVYHTPVGTFTAGAYTAKLVDRER